MYDRTLRLASTGFCLLALAALATACSAESGSRPAAGAPVTKAPDADAEPLSKAQLVKLLFQEGEVPQAREGGLAIQEPDTDSDDPSWPPISDPDCVPLLDVRNGEDAHAVASQLINWKDDIYPGSSTIASYEPGRAEEAFAELERALADCRSYSGKSYLGKFKAFVRRGDGPDVGDETVSFREIVPLTGTEAEDLGDRNEQFTVVRVGDVIVTFTRMTVGGAANFPEELISKQVRRLAEAQKR